MPEAPKQWIGLSAIRKLEEEKRKGQQQSDKPSIPQISTKEFIVAPSTIALSTIVPSATPVSPAIAGDTIAGDKPLLSQDTIVAQHTIVQNTIAGSPYTNIPNAVLDQVLPALNVYDQVVLIRLYRLSRGFKKDVCKVGYGTLAKACNMSTRQAQISIDRLIVAGWIVRLGFEQGGESRKDRGSIYKINLPAATTTTHGAIVRPTIAPPTTNKIKALKENTQTHEESSVGVNAGNAGVRSRYSLAECRQYAESLKGQGITNPHGFAKKIYLTGEDDEFIQEFLGKGGMSQQSSNLKAADPACPKCHGSGMEVVKGKGARRCPCRTRDTDAESIESMTGNTD